MSHLGKSGVKRLSLSPQMNVLSGWTILAQNEPFRQVKNVFSPFKRQSLR